MDPIKQFDVAYEFAQIGVDVRHRLPEVVELLTKFYYHIRTAEDFINGETSLGYPDDHKES